MRMDRILIVLLVAGAALAAWHLASKDDSVRGERAISARFCEDQFWLEQSLRFKRPVGWLKDESPGARDFHVEMAQTCFPDSPYFFTVGSRFYVFEHGELRIVTE